MKKSTKAAMNYLYVQNNFLKSGFSLVVRAIPERKKQENKTFQPKLASENSA